MISAVERAFSMASLMIGGITLSSVVDKACPIFKAAPNPGGPKSEVSSVLFFVLEISDFGPPGSEQP